MLPPHLTLEQITRERRHRWDDQPCACSDDISPIRCLEVNSDHDAVAAPINSLSHPTRQDIRSQVRFESYLRTAESRPRTNPFRPVL